MGDISRFSPTLPISLSLNHLAVLVSILLFVVVLVYSRFSKVNTLPGALPWVGLRHEWFAVARAHWRESKLGQKLLNEGYEKYGKRGRAFVTPSMTWRPVVVLPPSALPWLTRQPEDRVSQPSLLAHFTQAKYFFPSIPPDEVFHASTIKVGLNRHLASLTGDITEEVRKGIDTAWGADTEEWTSVPLLKTMNDVSSAISVRVFLGKELCQDEKFVQDTARYSLCLATGAGTLSIFVPAFLRPVLGPLVALPARYFFRRMCTKLVPLIQRRMAALSAAAEEAKEDPPDQPNDILQYHIAAALKSPSPIDRDPLVMCSRLCFILGFAAIQTISMTATNVFLNIAASDSISKKRKSSYDSRDNETEAAADTTSTSSPPFSSSPNTLAILRTEAAAALLAQQPDGTSGTWTRASLLSLARADSLLKETMRLNTFGGRGVAHTVVAADGLELPASVAPSPTGGGPVTLPQGAWVAVPVSEVHKDASVYAGAGEFRPWRFVGGGGGGAGEDAREREGEEGFGEEAAPGRVKGSLVTTTSDTFLAFGRGRHACPGRFFAANVLKLLLAHVALEYDVRPLDERPENIDISDFSVPSDKVKIEVRRRRKKKVE